MRDALVDNIHGKVVNYSKPLNKSQLQQQRLDEFYLLAYYDEAVPHNTPYAAPGFGFRESFAGVANAVIPSFLSQWSRN